MRVSVERTASCPLPSLVGGAVLRVQDQREVSAPSLEAMPHPREILDTTAVAEDDTDAIALDTECLEDEDVCAAIAPRTDLDVDSRDTPEVGADTAPETEREALAAESAWDETDPLPDAPHPRVITDLRLVTTTTDALSSLPLPTTLQADVAVPRRAAATLADRPRAVAEDWSATRAPADLAAESPDEAGVGSDETADAVRADLMADAASAADASRADPAAALWPRTDVPVTAMSSAATSLPRVGTTHAPVDAARAAATARAATVEAPRLVYTLAKRAVCLATDRGEDPELTDDTAADETRWETRDMAAPVIALTIPTTEYALLLLSSTSEIGRAEIGVKPSMARCAPVVDQKNMKKLLWFGGSAPVE